ncbi:MAG: RdgB/HAM1 family non-canonical purine NTP pyrophosphatase [Clostridiales bacterium]|nr:RdgB/HAM1 family non-canonical purine NTP pyrophosphatase [Clostridiales bacterium]
MLEILVATNNQGKVKEIKEIFTGAKIVSLKEAGVVSDVDETGSTFKENALLKARAVYEMTGKPTLGDDSGLAVDALGGAPGIYSARYAGPHGDWKANNAKLLDALKGTKDRSAHFVCAVAFICDKGEFVAEGRTEGEILYELTGDKGFGYDPVFYSFDLKKSFGLATAEEKNLISHRARALQNLKQMLVQNNVILSE